MSSVVVAPPRWREPWIASGFQRLVGLWQGLQALMSRHREFDLLNTCPLKCSPCEKAR